MQVPRKTEQIQKFTPDSRQRILRQMICQKKALILQCDQLKQFQNFRCTLLPVVKTMNLKFQHFQGNFSSTCTNKFQNDFNTFPANKSSSRKLNICIFCHKSSFAKFNIAQLQIRNLEPLMTSNLHCFFQQIKQILSNTKWLSRAAF